MLLIRRAMDGENDFHYSICFEREHHQRHFTSRPCNQTARAGRHISSLQSDKNPVRSPLLRLRCVSHHASKAYASLATSVARDTSRS